MTRTSEVLLGLFERFDLMNMGRFAIVLLLCPFLSVAQLREFEISKMNNSEVPVIQASTNYPNDALLLVYSSLEGLEFRSSLGVIDKVSYNEKLSRYEVLFSPQKQMLFVYARDYTQSKIATLNPRPKDVYSYSVEQKNHVPINNEAGKLTIITDPSRAEVYINTIKAADKTPFSGELPEASYQIKLRKEKYEVIDTLIVIEAGRTNLLDISLTSTTRWLNISTIPNGADVILDGVSMGKTPLSFELDLSGDNISREKQLELSLQNYQSIFKTINVTPSTKPLELDFFLRKDTGAYVVTSNPSGAKVFIDKKYKGVTPLRGSLEVGQYEVEVKLDGYASSKKNLSVSENGSNELSFTMGDHSVLPPEVGQFYGGGIVFDVSEDGHGLVVALEDLGKFNWNRARRKCESYDGGGFTDWYLPSKGEFKKLDETVSEVNNSLTKEGGDVLQTSYYWSSTKVEDRSGRAYMALGMLSVKYRKTVQALARPVRAF